MTIEEIINIVQNNHSGVVKNTNWGEVGLFYNPEGTLKKGIYLLTFKERDGENDQSSQLNRGGLYRLNLGISQESFIKLFGRTFKRPKAGGVVLMDFDFSQIDTIMPHPVYGWMSWICVINPSQETFEQLQPLIAESYLQAIKKYAKK